MQPRHKSLITECVALAIALIWPFVFLAPYTRNNIGIGNDFVHLYFNYKVYLLAMLAQGHFPLWSPTEGAGFPFFSNPFAQSFYPLNLLYLAYYKLVGRFVEWDYQVLTIFALSIFGAGLYVWLRQLKITTWIALIAVVVAVSSLKVTELLRFPNAAHSAAWMPWLLYAATLATSRRHLVAGAAIFAVALLMLLTAGYPYFIVYAVFLIGPYLLAMNFPVTRRALFLAEPEQISGRAAYATWLGGGAFASALIALPSLQHAQALMAQTVDRATPNFDYATEHSFGPLSTLGSWIFPPSASMEGWYYFGIATTLMIAFYLVCVALRHRVTPRDGLLLAIVVGWMALVIYFTWGRDSALFNWVWHHVPVLNQMRVWGRMNIILVPAIALLLATALTRYADVLSEPRPQVSSKTPAPVFAVFVAVAAVILALQYFLYRSQSFDGYWPVYFKHAIDPATAAWGKPWQHVRAFDERRFLGFTLVAGLAFVGLWIVARKWPHSMLWRYVALMVFLVISTREMFYISNYQWMYPPNTKTPVPFDPLALIRANFDKRRSITGSPTIAYPSLQYGVALTPNWGLSRHANFYLRYFKPDGQPRPSIDAAEVAAARRFFGADERAEHIFFTRSINHASPREFFIDADELSRVAQVSYRIDSYDGDRLTLTIAVNEPCWLTFVDNWDPSWTAQIDGEPAKISTTFGSYKAVQLPPGASKLVFDYIPSLVPWLVKK